VFSVLEYELGIMIACLPALRALFKYLSAREHVKDIERPSRSSEPGHDLESTSSWGDRALKYGGQNKVVISGGYAKD
jgi:hypothetical protein